MTKDVTRIVPRGSIRVRRTGHVPNSTEREKPGNLLVPTETAEVGSDKRACLATLCGESLCTSPNFDWRLGFCP